MSKSKDREAHRQLLELFEFSEEEIGQVLDVWIEGCKSFNLTAKDVTYAMTDYIPRYWDLSLGGVRLCIGAYLREVIEMFRMKSYLERGDKVIYCNMPVHPACVYANKIAGGDHLHICQPDFLIASILDPLFNRSFSTRINPVSCISGDCMHCEMNRYRIEAQMNDLLPSPTVTWNWGLYCNEGPKSEEYLEIMDPGKRWNYVVTTLPHDTGWGQTEAEDESRVRYLAEKFRNSQKEITAFTGIDVTEEHVKASLTIYTDYITKLEQLTELVCSSDPQPLGCNDFTMFCALQHSAFNTGLHYFDEALQVLLCEVRERVRKEEGILPKGCAKAACHFAPYCIPWLEGIFRANEINLSYSLFFAPASKQMRYLEADVYGTIAKHWLTNPSSVNMGNEADIVTEMLLEHPVDGVIYGFFSFDRWIGGIQKTMARIVEERTGVQHYYIEGDFWNDAKYTQEERMSRIENICYQIRIDHLMQENR